MLEKSSLKALNKEKIKTLREQGHSDRLFWIQLYTMKLEKKFKFKP